MYAFEIARTYKSDANNKEALKICNNVIKRFPKSLGAKKCNILKSQIKQKTLIIEAEKFIPINKNSRVLITYKNVDKLFFSTYKISEKQQENFNKLYKFEDRIAFINKLEIANNWEHQLRNEQDYLEHTTEVIVPKFKNGRYLIIASETKDLKENSIYGTSSIQSTNIAIIESNFEGEHLYQIVDRFTGKPIKNASIHIKNSHLNKYNRSINKNLVTNKNGFASFKSKNSYNNVKITVKTKNDSAVFGDFYLYQNRNYSNSEKENISIKPFISTNSFLKTSDLSPCFLMTIALK